MPLAAIVVIATVGSSVLTALITSFLAPLFRERFIVDRRSRRERRQESLDLLYGPLYESLSSVPTFPGETLEDLGVDILESALRAVQQIISANYKHADKELRERASVGYD